MHPQVRDVLFTGGDPMVMSTENVRKYIDPLLYDPATSHLNTIRIGTKSLAYWPYRFTHNKDAKELLNYFEQIVRSGKHLSIQAHFTHPRELGTAAVQEAMRLVRMTGAVIRTQAPLIRGINDSAELWSEMWNLQTKLGAIPYYM
jgi:L-lysine 2,3-aminomutase